MAKFISRKNPVFSRSLKRRPLGAVVVHHNAWGDVRFTRVHGGWLREHVDFSGLSPEVVSSAVVATECNRAFGFEGSWARIY